jgi:hypothetical protein
MSENTADFHIERLRRNPDNKDVSVRDLLALALADIDRGDFQKPTKAIIVIIDEVEGDGTSTVESYRCGMTRPEELGWLEAAKQHTWKRWTRESPE